MREIVFAALNSLDLAIEQLFLDSSPESPEIEFLYRKFFGLRDLMFNIDGLLERDLSGVMHDLDRRVGEAICHLRDVIEESLLSSQRIRDYESTSYILSKKSQKLLKQEIHSLFQEVQKIMEEYNTFLLQVEDISDLQVEDVNYLLPQIDVTEIDFDGSTSRMIGLEDEFVRVRDKLLNMSDYINFFMIVGMAGIGKTALARRLLEDSLIRDSFDCLIFLSIGQNPNFGKIRRSMLAQMMIYQEIDDQIDLSCQRYLIVFDDVWDQDILEKSFKPIVDAISDARKGSLIVVTTRFKADEIPDEIFYEMRFLNEEESWSLFCEELFGNQLCPPQFKKVGKEIVDKCEGLPLAIILIAHHLSKTGQTLQYWEKVAKDPISFIADEKEPLSQSLLKSYNFLSDNLKRLLLYMGVFPQRYQIPASKLFNLWAAERFGESIDSYDHLNTLVMNSVVLVCQRNSQGKIKTFKVHPAYWHLCVNEAGKQNFFHVVDRDVLAFPRGRKKHHRLCIHNNVLFGIKPLMDSMESNSTVRSLLCTGPHHQYPLPIRFHWRLLNILHALTIRFYKFPIEVVELVLLRYLALTYYGKLPSSISRLCKLEYLIVHQNLSIISGKAPSYLPKEIWDMQELRHLQVMGSDVPDPTSGALLTDLLVLLDVSARSCTERVLKSIPNLEKLGIQIDSLDPFNTFDHLSCLSELRSLKCNVIINPNSRTQIVALPASVAMFPSSLQKLSLSGFRCPWEQMSIIGELPNLEVLKLRSYAFQGPEWITDGEHFKQLKHLVLEDTDLVHWVAKPGCFECLRSLTIRHCYKLEDVPMELRHPESLQIIELVDAKTSLVESVKKIVQQQHEAGNESLQARVQFSWNDSTVEMPGTVG